MLCISDDRDFNFMGNEKDWNHCEMKEEKVVRRKNSGDLRGEISNPLLV